MSVTKLEKEELAGIQKRFHSNKLTSEDLDNVVIIQNVVATFSTLTFGWDLPSYTFDGFDAKHYNIQDSGFGLCAQSKKVIKDNGCSYCDILVIREDSRLYESLITDNYYFKYNKSCVESYRIVAAKLAK